MPPKGCRRYARKRSIELCPFCGASYERFRSDSVGSLRAVWGAMIIESEQAQAEGDFTRQARLNTVLGRMHQLKQAAWRDEHVYWCRMAAIGGSDNAESFFRAFNAIAAWFSVRSRKHLRAKVEILGLLLGDATKLAARQEGQIGALELENCKLKDHVAKLRSQGRRNLQHCGCPCHCKAKRQ